MTSAADDHHGILLPQVRRWFTAATIQSAPWTVEALVASKQGRTVSVVLPALNEESTIAALISALMPLVGSLVDELVVMDSGSTDGTTMVAREAGARVVASSEVLSHLESRPGKGEVLWRSLAVTSGDLIVFLDSDLVDYDSGFVPALVGPLLAGKSGVHLVKGFYRRPLRFARREESNEGGRVTELMARPLLNALRPELAGIVQPLGGEYAATRAFLESVPFAAGYGVEIGLLLDVHSNHGLSGIAQVNLGVRKHRNRPLHELGVMSRQILGAVLNRCGVAEVSGAEGITQFTQLGSFFEPSEIDVLIADRPPMRDVRPGRAPC